MFYLTFKRASNIVIVWALLFGIVFTPFSNIKAADHAESTSVAKDPGADLGDSFAFLSPNDNSRVVLAMTFDGFLVPSQALNLGYFPPDILYRFEIENNGDAIPDRFIDITFTPQTARNVAQTATIVMSNRRGFRSPPFNVRFNAPTTVSNFTPQGAPFVVTRDATSQIDFFAGLTDDPFYFDIVAFGRFNASVAAGMPDPTRFNRSRDSFAGYNIHTIALEVPAHLLRGSADNVIGVNAVTLRQRNSTRLSGVEGQGQVINSGDFVQVDRAGVPAVNTALIPFPRKNEFNAATTQDDANLRFADSIIGTLTALGTSQANIVILANVAVFKGDFLRLSLTTPNMSQGFGERITSPNYTGFPNGRRLGDDTIDTLLFFITNGALTMGDNVNSNEVPLTNTFPFFGRPHQPQENPTVDDRTRN
jgi:hypothetical protein